MIDTFVQAICDRRKVRVTLWSLEDRRPLTRKCAPMDYGPSRRAKMKNDRYHLWDYESDTRVHTLSLNPEQVLSIEVLDEVFDPSEFVTWSTALSPWFVRRDWGAFS